ncbi:MAG TPA: hypothetical protein DDZ51_05460 [Planctomycetaceae bacterium]|nr:hypothetical protein [Planctomycetaceae bacterium]
MLNYLQILCINTSSSINAMSHHPPSFRGVSRSHHRRGQALIEFAFVSIVMVMLVTGLMAILVMALGSFQNNISTENAGRQLDGHPLFIKENFVTHFTMDPDDPDPFFVDDDFENVTARQVYRFLNEYPDPVDGRVLYEERWLILSQNQWNDRKDLPLPAINRSLLGQYIFDPDIVVDGQQGGFRFPGAVVTNTQTGNRTVLVPLLPGPNSNGIDRTFNITSINPDFFFPVSQNWVAPVVIGKDQDGDGFQFRVIMFHPSQPAVSQRAENQSLVEVDDEGNDAVSSAIGALPAGYDLFYETPPAINSEYWSSSSRGQLGLGELELGPVGPVGPDGSPPPIPARTVRPFRMVFETSSLFRMGAHLNPIAVKYEADEIAIPFPSLVDQSVVAHPADIAVAPFVHPNAYESMQDQVLNFDRQVIDRSTDELRRYFIGDVIPVSADNDFAENVLWLQPNDDGVWRVSVSAEFQVFDDPGDPGDDADEWVESHELELRLYKNGAFERLIVRQVVSVTMFDPAKPNPTVVLQGDILTRAIANDVYQVRVFTRRPATDPLDPMAAAPEYDVQLTGTPENNWVSFERVRD